MGDLKTRTNMLEFSDLHYIELKNTASLCSLKRLLVLFDGTEYFQ